MSTLTRRLRGGLAYWAILAFRWPYRRIMGGVIARDFAPGRFDQVTLRLLPLFSSLDMAGHRLARRLVLGPR